MPLLKDVCWTSRTEVCERLLQFVGETSATPDAAAITGVNWIRLSANTHSFNENQRINHLGFTQTANALSVTAPSSANLCPPGHYMLFILKNGVPSIAQIIQIQ